ncbi:hypothetical protein V1264_017792 [Littorina saxatilis]|uniref:Uncharacterized protein n=1 Tax=Littorina saxatilis TaxID=31220 RepID=A0AAN9BJ53_9CAEN
MPKRGGDSSLCDVRNEQTSCSSQAGPIDTCWCQQNITHYIFVYHFTAIAGQHDGFWYCKKICRADNTLFSLHMKYDVECLDVGINYDENVWRIWTKIQQSLELLSSYTDAKSQHA